MSPMHLLLEIGALALFVAAAWLALRRGRLPFLELVSAALFGLMLEQANQVLYETYEYSPEFVLVLDRSPVVIGLTWALIIAGAMRITDALGVRGRYAPVVDSLLAIMLDLAFDAVAIRMGLWTWRDIALTDGWFGVPAGNFWSWLFVTLGFTLFTRVLRDRAHRRRRLEWLQLLVPIPAFALLTISIGVFAVIVPVIDDAPGGGMLAFWVALAAFTAVSAWAVWGPDRGRPDGARDAIVDLRLAFATRVAIHAVFLAALLWLGIPSTAPVLLVVSVALFVAEWPLALLVRNRQATTGATVADEQEAGRAATVGA